MNQINEEINDLHHNNLYSYNKFRDLNITFIQPEQQESKLKSRSSISFEIFEEIKNLQQMECKNSLGNINVKEEPKDDDFNSYIDPINFVSTEIIKNQDRHSNIYNSCLQSHIKSTANEKYLKTNAIKSEACSSLSKLSSDFEMIDKSNNYIINDSEETTRNNNSSDICNEKKRKLINFPSNIKEKPFACNVCNRRFAESSILERHKNIHINICEICNRSFTKRYYLTRHIKTHTNEKPFMCEICPKKYSRKEDLMFHMNTHTNEKPFVCDICGRGFARKSDLSSHKNTHKDEKPFVCNICGRAFARRANQLDHMRTHTNEKPFVCNICQKRFGHKSTLVGHIRIHTNEKPFACEICQRTFSLRGSLRRHMRCHTNEKPFSCDPCEKKFARKANLLAHNKTVHMNMGLSETLPENMLIPEVSLVTVSENSH